jgi:hypothetical protein
MQSITTAIRVVKSPTLPRPTDDDSLDAASTYEPTAEDWASLRDEAADTWTVEELEDARAMDEAAREQSARFAAWCDAGRPPYPVSDVDRALSGYLIRPELATWLAYSGGHERV